jgi:hypothetical protein
MSRRERKADLGVAVDTERRTSPPPDGGVLVSQRLSFADLRSRFIEGHPVACFLASMGPLAERRRLLWLEFEV